MKSDLYFKTMEARDSWFLAFMISFSLGTVFIILATFSLFFITSRASKKIHTSMTTLTITTKMDFFCSNLMGVILNRFSKDVNNLDEDLPFNLYLAISLFLEVLGICALIISSNWIFLIPILIIVFAGFLFMKFVLFLVIAKVKRLESALHSPMVGYLTSTIKGLSTIRVLGTNDEQLVNQFDQYQDLFATASFIIICSIQLLKYCIYILSNLFVIVILVYFISTGDATPGDVGIGIGKSMAMFRYIRKLLNIVMELEADMTSMERITDYLNLKSENNSGYELAETWPETGAITLKNVNLIYSSINEHVLKNIDLKINSREKVVLIGRTGSGKSSLISCLFRLFDYSGSIIIDDINIKGLELNYLRSRFGIVSQETAVFDGTLRQNLDPFNQYSDEDIFRVTNKIRYFCSNSKSILSLRNLPLCTLNKKLKDLTPSEMLLVSFMRIMLTKKRIIILDEVASNLDESTIEIIDQLIEEYFQNQTVITIAHRLKNIKNMDKICVLAAGKILEFGTYEDLMNNPKSELCKMIHKTSNFSK